MADTEVIQVEHDGETKYAVMEVRPVGSGVMAVVHYGDQTEADSRTWGTGPEERRNMRVMAEAKLIQMLSFRTPPGG